MVFGNTNAGICNKQLPQNEEVDCDTINEESNTQLGQNDPVPFDKIDEIRITIEPPKSTATKMAEELGISRATVERNAQYAKAIDKIDEDVSKLVLPFIDG